MIGAVAQQFPPDGSAGSCGSRRVPTCGAPRRRDHQIPVNLPESGQDLGTLGEVERGDDPLLLHPLVDAELIAHLSGLLGAEVAVILEIDAEIPCGVPDHVVRTVTENGRTLKFTSQGFEKE